jgi:hypothetical protein
MRPATIDLRPWAGRNATLEIVDASATGWGNVGVGPIRLTDEPMAASLDDLPGAGSIALVALGDPKPEAIDTQAQRDGRPVGTVAASVTVPPRGSAVLTFVLAWHFPHYGPPSSEMRAIAGFDRLKRHYASRFPDATAVARHVAANTPSLLDTTRLWNRTWYDSTLPHWLLDRAFIPNDCLATQTLHGFDTGRWWGWEGVDCCPGTCQHVWQYAQGAAFVQPEIERAFREITDFGLAWNPDGSIDYRSENGRRVAHDGLCGTVVRAYREHAMSPDDAFLRRIWPRVAQTMRYLMAQDRDADGLLEGVQYNTLDAEWAGPMGWISSLFVASLEAGAAMADAMADPALATACRDRARLGRANLVAKLFNGRYFIHRPPDFTRTNTNDGCHIDQVFGQSLAWAAGLPLSARAVPEPECRLALESLWTHNFAPDVGPYREKSPIKGGRWYAMPGEAGLLMCTWPEGGADRAAGTGTNATFVGYFNECMNGFEYQVAAHMVYESRRPDGTIDGPMLEKGLAVARAIHDRYAPARRNPYNEIECSDHYARSMAAYAVFLAACGFEHHGPQGHLGFAPRITPEAFRAPFTSCSGWGTFNQQRDPATGTQSSSITLAHGHLHLSSLALDLADPRDPASVTFAVDDRPALPASRWERTGRRLIADFEPAVHLVAGERLVFSINR